MSYLLTYISTGKPFSEAFILASTNQKYDKRLFMELRVQYNLATSKILDYGILVFIP